MSDYFLAAGLPSGDMHVYEHIFLLQTGPMGYTFVEMMFMNNRGTGIITLRSAPPT